MIKNKIVNTNLEVYEETISNGMRIFVIPMPNFSSHYVTFTTNFGSNHLTFKKEGSDFRTVSSGIAHFLEHKMFEQKEGIDPFIFFSKNGADCNANTSNIRTTYLFEGRESLKENLNYLIDFVQDLYLTEENVKKEKGIIIEEEKMYYDIPQYRLYDMNMKNTFVNNNFKTPIIGTQESIMNITKEELEYCYNHFYHPSQMYLIAVGNVDPKEVIDIVENNQKNKQYQEPYKIMHEEIEEPEYVSKEYEEDFIKIENEKAIISYKIKKTLDIDHEEFTNYLYLYSYMKLGKLSQFNENLLKNQKILSSLEIYVQEAKPYSIIQIAFEGKKLNDVITSINQELLNLVFNEEDLELIKRNLINKFKDYSDKPESNNYLLLEQLAKDNKINLNYIKDIEKLSKEQLLIVLKSINFENRSVSILKPLD